MLENRRAAALFNHRLLIPFHCLVATIDKQLLLSCKDIKSIGFFLFDAAVSICRGLRTESIAADKGDIKTNFFENSQLIPTIVQDILQLYPTVKSMF